MKTAVPASFAVCTLARLKSTASAPAGSSSIANGRDAGKLSGAHDSARTTECLILPLLDIARWCQFHYSVRS
jgi:hypothetical protein